MSIKEAFQERKFRESRDKNNKLTNFKYFHNEEKDLISHLFRRGLILNILITGIKGYIGNSLKLKFKNLIKFLEFLLR